MGERRDAYRILVLKPEGKIQLRKPRHRWENNIRTDLNERRWKGVDWIDLVQYRDKWWAVVNTVMNPQVPYNAGNFLTNRAICFSRRTLLCGVS
jgi:ribosome biogenesis protein Nip4